MEVPPFDPAAIGPGYVWAAVSGHIAARIAAGELRSGDRLPAERDMALAYGVSDGTIRRALADLRERGLVQTFPQKGSYIV